MCAVPLILALLTIACEPDHDRWLRGMRAAAAVSWLHELNYEETQFEGKTGRYGTLEELRFQGSLAGFSAVLKLPAPDAYVVTLRPNIRSDYSFFSDQTSLIRKCPGTEEPTAGCPAIAARPDPTLIAIADENGFVRSKQARRK
jgi:hypothetical protein